MHSCAASHHGHRPRYGQLCLVSLLPVAQKAILRSGPQRAQREFSPALQGLGFRVNFLSEMWYFFGEVVFCRVPGGSLVTFSQERCMMGCSSVWQSLLESRCRKTRFTFMSKVVTMNPICTLKGP